MGKDNEIYPRAQKDTFDLSFIRFGISRSRFSDYKISSIDLGYPIPDVLFLDIPEIP
jgi:hypothetical protein